MNLTEPMRRELLYLAANCNNSGHVDEGCFRDRREMFDGDPMDLGLRYSRLEELGYVDTVMRLWDGDIGYARVTEEGRFAAREIIAQELESARISSRVKKAAFKALEGGMVSVAAQSLISFLGLL